MFIDETGLSTKMARLRGRARAANAAGLACRTGLEDHHLHRSAAADRHDPPFVYDGAMNGTVFLAYVSPMLVPTLERGDVVVMDNVPAHRRRAFATQ
ncbi:transposase [Mesorhizobium sp. M0027]|uniref:transposase n=1 Tax=Mesorhizobium sp. M0027 TaxID=2956848 RepID=UPI003334AC34